MRGAMALTHPPEEPPTVPQGDDQARPPLTHQRRAQATVSFQPSETRDGGRRDASGRPRGVPRKMTPLHDACRATLPTQPLPAPICTPPISKKKNEKYRILDREDRRGPFRAIFARGSLEDAEWCLFPTLLPRLLLAPYIPVCFFPPFFFVFVSLICRFQARDNESTLLFVTEKLNHVT